MYSLNLPVAAIRTKVRQEFERHRFVNQLPVVDMLLFQSHAEFQVRLRAFLPIYFGCRNVVVLMLSFPRFLHQGAKGGGVWRI